MARNYSLPKNSKLTAEQVADQGRPISTVARWAEANTFVLLTPGNGDHLPDAVEV